MDEGFGITIAFATTAFACELLDLTPPEASRESIDVTHMAQASAFKSFMPSDLVDWGEAKLTIAFDPGIRPPIDQPKEIITISFPDEDTWVFTGFFTKYSPKAPMEDKMTAEVTLKVDGNVTVTAAT